MTKLVAQLLDFLAESPTAFHAVENMRQQLDAAGYEFVDEAQHWQPFAAGQGYYTIRNSSSLVAWKMPLDKPLKLSGLRMVGAHTDSPCLKIKPQPELQQKNYQQLGVEVYGGALLNPWFDRDLSLAGRVNYLNTSKQRKQALLDVKRPVAVISSLAIHLDREANKSHPINPQLHLPVLLGQADDKQSFKDWLLQQLLAEGLVEADRVLDYEISLYDTQPPKVIGLTEQFIASARLDNLLSCFAGLQALIGADTTEGGLLVCNDHEEVGSMSSVGAQGPMLAQVIARIVPEQEERAQMLRRSLLISVDNAHAIHPNYIDKHDSNHGPLLNAGAVIKQNVNQRYATNSETSALIHDIANRENIPLQSFVVRSDMACGSTIGPITAAELGVRTLDLGMPQLAMHSIRELAGVKDLEYMVNLLSYFYKEELL